jgi:hypothetical protein
MTWQKEVTITASPSATNLQTALYLADSYSAHPGAPCHDELVPADTEYGSVYFGGYTQDLLDSGDEAALAAFYASLTDALATAAGYPGFTGATALQIYYSDSGGTPPNAPRAICFARDWTFYIDEPLASMLPNGTDAADFLAILNTLRAESLTALGFSEV